MGTVEFLVTELGKHSPVPPNEQINWFALSLSTSFVSWASVVLRTDVIA